MTDVVLVLGMHRSGTSSVAGALTKLGGGMPKHLMAADQGNARGYFESVAFMRFHDELLESAGSNWRDWRLFNPEWRQSPVAADFRRRAKELFAEEFNGSALPVLKDPRTCRFAPFWLDVLRDIEAKPHIVMPIRSPLDVAQSLKTVHGLSLTHGLLLWLRHVLDAESHSRSVARSIFAWKDFRSDWRGTCDKIAAETHLSWPRLSDRAAREIDRFLTKELVHHDTDDAALVAHADVHEWAVRAYEALLELARSPLSNSALATLDDVRMLLDQSSKIFGRLLIDNEVDLEDARGQAQAAIGERDGLRARQIVELAGKAAALAALAARAEQAEKARQEAAREKDALAQSLAAALAEREALQQSRAGVAAELQARRQELAAKAAALAELAARAERAEKAHEEAAREKEALAQSLAAALAERDALQAAHFAVAAELDARRRDLDEFAALSEEIEAALEEAARDKEGLSQTLAAAVAEREALSAAHAGVAAELQARRRELEEKTAVAAEQTARAQAAERAREAAAREKDALAQSLAAALAEREALSAAHAGVAAELQARRQELAETTAIAAEQTARARRAEAARDETAAASEALSRSLAASFAERDALDSANSRIVAELEARRQELADKAAAAAAFAVRADAAEAAHARALAEAQSVHQARIRALRAELVDAEAALARAKATGARRGVGAWLMPASASRRRLAKRLLRSGLFDAEFYRAHYPAAPPAPPPDGAKADLAAAEHYLEEGFCRGYRANPLFDTRWYLERYEDVRRSGLNPLLHYWLHGWREGRDPGPGFQSEYYLEANPDVRAAGVNPLAHYLRHGRHEGRPAVRPPG
ncbi:MAG: hypothetical protein ABSC22_00060 [Roseiarcus sp.]